jgi:hypothetical protein
MTEISIPLIEPEEVGKALSVVIDDGQAFEIRILSPRYKGRRWSPRVLYGYFDDPAAVVAAIQQAGLEGAKGVYFTLNPIDPALLARGHNRLVEAKDGQTTADTNIVRRRWLLIDCDPKRPSGISASEEEKEQAHAKAREVFTFLQSEGWPEPVAADSGNGFHLLYRIDLPTDDGGQVKQVLEALSERFTDEYVEIDTTVYNPARICKLYGTRAEKGDHCPALGREHRLSRLLAVPEAAEIVPEDKLRDLAGEHTPLVQRMQPSPARTPPAGRGHAWTQDDVQSFIDHNLSHCDPAPPQPYGNGYKWVLRVCPFNPDHSDRSAVVTIRDDGVLGFRCHHNGCNGNNWRTLRERFGRSLPRSPRSTPRPAPQAAAEPTPQEPEEWPPLDTQPDFDELPDAPIDAMPPVLGDMAREIAEAFQVPVDTTMLAVLVVAGFAAGNWHRVSIKRGVMARANIYALFFLAPGERKSTVFNPAVQPVEDWITGHEEAWDQAVLDRRIQENQVNEVVKLLSKPNTKPEQRIRLRAQLDELREQEQDIRNPRILADESTMEDMLVQMDETGGRLGVFSDDARGFLQILTGIYSEGKTRESLIVKSYDGTAPIRSGRRSRKRITIHNPCMGILLMVQLDWLAKLSEQEDLFASGHNSRFFYCVPDSLVGRKDGEGQLRRAYSEREVAASVADAYASLITRLLDESYHLDDFRDVPLDPAAKELWVAYYNRVEQELAKCGEYSDSVDVAIRFPTQALRLALVSALCRDAGSVSLDDMENGIRLADYYSQHAGRALQAMRRQAIPKGPRRVIAHLRRHNKEHFTQREIQQALGFSTAGDAAAAVGWLLEHRYCREAQDEDAEKRPGRPASPGYDVNPHLFD